MDHSTPGSPVFHCLPEFGQIYVGSFGDTVQPSRPLSSPSPLAFTISQHQGHFQGVFSSHEMGRKGVALIVNKRVGKAVLGYNLKNDRMISIRIQGRPFNITAIQVYALTTNAEEHCIHLYMPPQSSSVKPAPSVPFSLLLVESVSTLCNNHIIQAGICLIVTCVRRWVALCVKPLSHWAVS